MFLRDIVNYDGDPEENSIAEERDIEYELHKKFESYLAALKKTDLKVSSDLDELMPKLTALTKFFDKYPMVTEELLLWSSSRNYVSEWFNFNTTFKYYSKTLVHTHVKGLTTYLGIAKCDAEIAKDGLMTYFKEQKATKKTSAKLTGFRHNSHETIVEKILFPKDTIGLRKFTAIYYFCCYGENPTTAVDRLLTYACQFPLMLRPDYWKKIQANKKVMTSHVFNIFSKASKCYLQDKNKQFFDWLWVYFLVVMDKKELPVFDGDGRERYNHQFELQVTEENREHLQQLAEQFPSEQHCAVVSNKMKNSLTG